MKLESRVRILAGTFVLLGIALAYFINPWWLILAAFVGVNLIQSAFTSFCPAEIILSKLHWRSRAQSGSGAPPP